MGLFLFLQTVKIGFSRRVKIIYLLLSRLLTYNFYESGSKVNLESVSVKSDSDMDTIKKFTKN